MKPIHLTTIILGLVLTGLVSAGAYEPRPVDIEVNGDGSGNATGGMTTARFSDNDVEYIGCGIRLYAMPDGSYMHWGFCQAKDASGTQAFCNTQDPKMLDVMKATGDYSYITFEWNSDEECTGIGFSTQSFYIPEHTNNNNPGHGRGGP